MQSTGWCPLCVGLGRGHGSRLGDRSCAARRPIRAVTRRRGRSGSWCVAPAETSDEPGASRATSQAGSRYAHGRGSPGSGEGRSSSRDSAGRRPRPRCRAAAVTGTLDEGVPGGRPREEQEAAPAVSVHAPILTMGCRGRHGDPDGGAARVPPSELKRPLSVAARSASASSTAARRSGGPSSVTTSSAPPPSVARSAISIRVSGPRRTACSVASRRIWYRATTAFSPSSSASPRRG